VPDIARTTKAQRICSHLSTRTAPRSPRAGHQHGHRPHQPRQTWQRHSPARRAGVGPCDASWLVAGGLGLLPQTRCRDPASPDFAGRSSPSSRRRRQTPKYRDSSRPAGL